MKNKKLVLSVLSTTVVASMATSAMAAAPSAGLYLGGEVDKYYALENFVNDEFIDAFSTDLANVAPENVVYVDMDGKAATLQTIIDEDDWQSALLDLNDEENLTTVFGDDADDAFAVIDEKGEDSGDVVTPDNGGGNTDVPAVDSATSSVEGKVVTISGTVENADDVRVTLIDKDNKSYEYLASEGQVEFDQETGEFTFTSAELTEGDWSYEVTAINGDVESDATKGTFKVEAPAPAELKVESVSAINATTFVAKLAEPKTGLTTADFKVLVDGTEVTPSALTADSTGANYTLTVPSLDNKKGVISINGTEFSFDFVAPKVEKVETLTAKQVKITLSKKATDVEKEDFRVVTPLGGTINVTAISKLSDTEYKATLASDLAIGEYVLEVQNDFFKDVYGKSAAKQFVKFDGAVTEDNAGPELVSATYNKGTGNLTLNFDEIVDLSDANFDETKIQIGNGTTFVTLTEAEFTGAADNANSVTIALNATNKAAVNALTGELVVKVGAEAVRDVSAKQNKAGELTTTVALETPPLVKSAVYDESLNTLTVEFDQAVDVSTISDFTKVGFKLNSATTYDYADSTSKLVTTTNGNTVVFELGGIAEVTTATAASLEIKAGFVKNTAGVANEPITASLTYTDDTVKPVLQSASYETISNELVLNFSEPVQLPALTDITLYDLDVDGNLNANVVLSSTNWEAPTYYPGSKTKVVIKAKAAGETQAEGLDPATAAVAIKNVTDEAGNIIDELKRADKKGIKLAVADNTPPTLNATSFASIDINTVEVVFDEKVDPSTAQNVANYKVVKTANPSQSLVVKSATLKADGRTVVLVTDNQENITYKLTVSGVKDVAGNVIVNTGNSGDDVATIVGTTNTLVAPNATSATFVDKNASNGINEGDTVTIQFSAPIKLAGTVSASDFVFTTTGENFGSGFTAAIKSDDNTKLVITLGSAPNLTFSSSFKLATNTVIKGLNDKVATSGNLVVTNSVTQPTITSIKAEIADPTKKFAAGDKLVLKFDQPVNITDSDTALASLTGITWDLSSGSATKDVITKTGSDELTITVKSNTAVGALTPVNLASGVSIAYSASAVSGGILNGWNQEVTGASVTVTGVEVDGPTLQSVNFIDAPTVGSVGAGDKLVLSFNEPIYVKSGLNSAQVAGLLTATNATLDSNAVASNVYVQDGTKLVVTLTSGAAISSGAKLNIAASAANLLFDAYGNDAKVLDNAVSINLGQSDTTAPTLTSVSWDDANSDTAVSANDRLTLTFSEAMDKNTLPEGAFGSGTAAKLVSGAADAYFGSGATGSWNAAGTQYTITLGAIGSSDVFADAQSGGVVFNPSSAVTDLAGNADGTVFAVTFKDNLAPVDVTAASVVVTNKDTVTSDAADADTVVLKANGASGSWAASKIQDGDNVLITVGAETLTYTLQSGDVAKLTSSTDIALFSGSTPVSGASLTSTFAAFDAAILDGGTVTVKLKDKAGNVSSGVNVGVTAD